MMFRPSAKSEAYNVTSRKVAAFERRKIREQQALPLFADLVAANQLSAEDEMQRRSRLWDHTERQQRAFKADSWRRARARYYALPAHVRAAVREYWRRYGGPKDAVNLSSVLWHVSAQVAVSGEDFPQLSAQDRREMTADLNDRARRNDPWTRCTRAFSAGALRWLSPGWVASEQYPEPVMHLTTSHTRYMQLWHALAEFSDFGHNADPSGERRAGLVEVDGQLFAFEILYRRPKSPEPCPTPWNADLSRRVLFVRLADECGDPRECA